MSKTFLSKVKIYVKTILTVFAFSFDKVYDIEKGLLSQFANREEYAGAIWCVLSVGLLLFYSKDSTQKTSMLEKMCAALFAIVMLLGRSFSLYNNWNMIFASYVQFIMSVFAGMGWGFFFNVALIWFYEALDKINLSFSGKEHFWRMASLLISAGWLPYIINRFPGSVPWDGMWQLTRWFGYGGALTNHHPFFSSLIFATLMKFGRMINDNVGVFLIVLFQTTVCAVIYGYISNWVRKQTGDVAGWLTVVFFAILPVWGSYASTVIKDTLFAAVFALYFCWFIRIWEASSEETDKQTKGCDWVLFLVLNVLVCLLRNDGVYRVIPAGIALLFFAKKNRRNVCRGIVGLCILVIAYNYCVFDVMKVPKGSWAEMYSIPFQQTARYVRDSRNDVEIWEQDAINNVLSFDELSTKYNEELSDPVKSTAKSKEYFSKYLKAWLSMGIRHPGIYIQATFNNSYGYIYPFRNSRLQLAYQNYIKGEPLNNGYFDIYYLANEERRSLLNNWGELWRIMPGLSLLSNPGTYFWVIVLSGLLLIKRKHYRNLTILCLPTLHLAICIASPLNGSLRYAMPLIACAPSLISYVLNIFISEGKKCDKRDNKKIMSQL